MSALTELNRRGHVTRLHVCAPCAARLLLCALLRVERVYTFTYRIVMKRHHSLGKYPAIDCQLYTR